MRCYRLLVAVLWQLCALSALAAPASAAPNHIAAELVAESAAMPGETITLAIHMRPEPSWHGYWSNPGDAGFGMTLDWTLPPGAKAGAMRYPVPQTLVVAGLMNHIYKGDYAVLVPLTLPADARPGATLPVAVNAQWLACTDQVCVPERGRLETTVTVGPHGAADKRFDQWRARLPAPLGAIAHITRDRSKYRLGIPLPASMPVKAPHFFATEESYVAYAAPQAFFRKGDLLIVELESTLTDQRHSLPELVSGVLRINEAGDGLSINTFPGSVPDDGEPLPDTPGIPATSLPLLLLAALAGGLLLNVMPCVFPILSLKALSLARAGGNAAQARAEGLAYTAGVVLACVALGGLLLGLRAAGEEVGWAFQLQEPAVVVALLLLATAITANLLGLFEFAVPGFASTGSPQGAFATGLLAAFVATPCTGPFMAAAMGAALLLPLLPAMALFVALGLGIALPFLAVAFIPALRRRLPRPGPWMVHFRRWMALPMGLTALALGWLAWQAGGSGFGVFAVVNALLFVAVLGWLGATQRRNRPALLPGIAVVAAFAAGVIALPAPAPPASRIESLLDAKPFSESTLAQARASGKPVFVWLTADWCLTCKVNEQVAIEKPAVRDAFARAGVVVLRGDWTRRDPAITRYLTAQGAAGVPLYVWYPAGGAPRQLPQVLGPGSLVDLAAP